MCKQLLRDSKLKTGKRGQKQSWLGEGSHGTVVPSEKKKRRRRRRRRRRKRRIRWIDGTRWAHGRDDRKCQDSSRLPWRIGGRVSSHSFLILALDAAEWENPCHCRFTYEERREKQLASTYWICSEHCPQSQSGTTKWKWVDNVTNF